MSQLIVVTDPDRAVGFLLAGVQAFGITDSPAAQERIREWYEQGESGLVAIGSQLFSEMDADFIAWMDDLEDLYYVEIPTPGPEGGERGRRERYLSRLRETIGFRVTFEGEGGEQS